MNIVAVDDEGLALKVLICAIKEASPQANVHGFACGEDALEFVKQTPCDVAFLDVEMGSIDGMSLAKELKKINSILNIVFTTGHSGYACEAITLRSSGYILKPVTAEKVKEELANLRNDIDCHKALGLWVRCFGNFEVFDGNDVPVTFKHSKTKELFAYLIDRNGAYCSNGEIIAALWENQAEGKVKNSYLRDLRADIVTTLHNYGVGNAICKRRGYLAIVPDQIVCDYYLWLKNDVQAINSYRGEYMSQYSWSEITLSGLESKSKKAVELL